MRDSSETNKFYVNSLYAREIAQRKKNNIHKMK